MALEVQLGGARITTKVTPVPSAPILNGGCRKTRCFRVNHYTRYICSQSLQMHHEGWGSHLGEHTARGTMVPSRSKLHFYYLELRWSFGPLIIPRPLVEQYCYYIYRQDNSGCLYEGRRGMKSGPLCALLWRILTWFSRKQVTSPTHSRRLNVIAHKLSSVTQLNRADKMVPPVSFSKQYASGGTKAKWACLLPPGSTTVSTFITGGRSPNMDNDTIGLPWEDLNPYAFPLVAILGKGWRSCRTAHAGKSF